VNASQLFKEINNLRQTSDLTGRVIMNLSGPPTQQYIGPPEITWTGKIIRYKERKPRLKAQEFLNHCD